MFAAGSFTSGSCKSSFLSGMQARVVVLERTKEAGKKVLMSGGTRCNVLPSEVDLDKDFFTDSSQSALRAIFASWGVWQCWSWLSEAEHVGLQLSLEEESNKWFPTSNSSRQVRDKLVKACEYAALCCLHTPDAYTWRSCMTSVFESLLRYMCLCGVNCFFDTVVAAREQPLGMVRGKLGTVDTA